MSKKTELQADLQRINYLLARAHLTPESRSGTFKNFAEAMRALNYGIHCAAQIGGKHVQAYIRYRSENGIVSNEGLSQREARIATSLDLGHGDGRGRYPLVSL